MNVLEIKLGTAVQSTAQCTVLQQYTSHYSLLYILAWAKVDGVFAVSAASTIKTGKKPSIYMYILVKTLTHVGNLYVI